jgi:hypothetical protein
MPLINEHSKLKFFKGTYIITAFTLINFLISFFTTLLQELINSKEITTSNDFSTVILAYALRMGLYLGILFITRRKCHSYGARVNLKDYFIYFGIYKLLSILILLTVIIQMYFINLSRINDMLLNAISLQLPQGIIGLVTGLIFIYLGLRNDALVNRESDPSE